jgi:hypothetical protein
MSKIYQRGSFLQENKTLLSKLARRAIARKSKKKAQVKKKKMMIVIMRAPDMIPMRWLSSYEDSPR